MRPVTQRTLDRLITFSPHSSRHDRHTSFGMLRLTISSHFRSGSSYCYECLRAACNFNKSLYSGSPLGSNLPSWESESVDKHSDCSYREKGWWLQSPFTEAREKREGSGRLWSLLGSRGWGHGWSPTHDRSAEEISYCRTRHSSHPLDPNHLKRVLYLVLSGHIPQVPLNFKIT